jgi:glycosyltransferase involved in cell wall biosynthesis
MRVTATRASGEIAGFPTEAGKHARNDVPGFSRRRRRRPHRLGPGQAARFRTQDSSTPSVSVVIPTLNEAENIAYVLHRIPHWVEETIIVDGRSTDNTVSVAKEARPDVVVVYQEGRGKGDAISAGCRAATGDIIVLLDADGSTDPAEIPRFVTALRTGGDFAKGTRFMVGGGSADITWIRSVGNKGLARLVNVLFGAKFTDLCYGYFAFWRRCLPDLSIDCDGFEVEALIAVRALRANIRVVEVPSFETPRLHGTSKLSARRDGIRIVRTIIAEWLRP